MENIETSVCKSQKPAETAGQTGLSSFGILFVSLRTKALFKTFGTTHNTIHYLYAIVIRKSHGGTELLQCLSFVMPMYTLQDHSPWWKPLLMGASSTTALPHLADKLGFQVRFNECPLFWIEAYLARDLCRSNSKWKNKSSLRPLPASLTGNNLRVTWGSSLETGGLRSEGQEGHFTHPFLSCSLWTLANVADS